VIREDPNSGLAALLERRAEIAAMSRRITPTEIAEFIFEYGYVPMEVPVARHASTVFVHNDNANANFLIPSKVDRLHPVRRNLYLYITRPSRSNPHSCNCGVGPLRAEAARSGAGTRLGTLPAILCGDCTGEFEVVSLLQDPLKFTPT